MTELSGNPKYVFLAIARGKFATDDTVRGPARAASVLALMKRKLIVNHGVKDGARFYTLTKSGQELFAELVPPINHRHNERTLGYVKAIRAELGSAVAGKSDHDIAEKVWRVASVERAVEKAKEELVS